VSATSSTGVPVSSEVLRGALTGRDGGEAMEAWFQRAHRRLDPSIRRESIVSIDVPFFVTDSMVRNAVQKKVPQRLWNSVLFDLDGRLAKALGLSKECSLYVFALDAAGRILATARGFPSGEAEEAIWAAFRAGSE
jgi:hypothetical protein